MQCVGVRFGLYSGSDRNAFNCARPTKAFRFLMPLLKGVAEAALYCAHRTSTVSPCAFCEQEGHLAAPSHPSEAAHCASTENRPSAAFLSVWEGGTEASE